MGPDTLQSSLLARLDRLGETKEIAQIAAIIGREFSYALLALVCERPEMDLESALYRLVQSELVFSQGLPPEATYRFKHALIQDIAYGSILRRRRQELHHRVAKVFKDEIPQVGETTPEVIAFHFSEADQFELAVPFWVSAVLECTRNMALQEALANAKSGFSYGLASAKTPGAMAGCLQLKLAEGVAAKSLFG